MSLASEAAYLYLYSKELTRINKELKRLSSKAEKHAHKHSRAPEEKKHKHLKKHAQAKENITKIMRRHNQIIGRIKHHLVGYNDALRKEHKL